MLYHAADREFQSLDGGGPVLGVFPGAVYQNQQAEMLDGDVFVGYTDGVTEAMNTAGKNASLQYLVQLGIREIQPPK